MIRRGCIDDYTFNTPSFKIMALKLYENIPLSHEASDCARELGRVRGVILFDKSLDLSSLIKWLAADSSDNSNQITDFIDNGIAANTIHILPKTSGSFDGGTAKTGEGYNTANPRLLWYDYTLEFSDPSYRDNRDFWQHADYRNWKIAWRTDNLFHIVNVPVAIVSSNPIDDSLTSDVVWKATATWRSVEKVEIVPLGVLTEYFNTEHAIWTTYELATHEDIANLFKRFNV